MSCFSRVLILCLLSLNVQAAQRALVIGNAAYPGPLHLANPVNDARAMRDLLQERLGFDQVLYLSDADKRAFWRKLETFENSLNNRDTALFYFSGHGFKGKDAQGHDTNYLLTVYDTPTRSLTRLEDLSVPARAVLKAMQRRNPQGVNLIILDSCRNALADLLDQINPAQAKSLDGSRPGGFTQMSAPGALIAYATGLGKTAYGNKDGDYSVYTGLLLEVLGDRSYWHRNITEVFNEV